MFWREPDFTLQVEPTRRCNLNCAICMRKNLEDLDSLLSLEKFKKLLEFKNFRFVGLHGWGEPLLNPEIFKMIEYAESKGIYTNLTSNGILIGENIAQVFESGLREIAFGIYNRKLFPVILPQIKGLIRERNERRVEFPRIYMDIAIYKNNLRQIPDLIKVASDIGFDAVILHRLFNVYNVDSAVKYISREEEKKLFIKAKELARKKKLELYLPRTHSLPCRVVKRSIFVTVKGEVTPCCFLPRDCMGNALKENIKEIRRSRKYTDFIKMMNNHPVCSKCRW